MRIVISPDADLAVRRLTNGQFHLAADDHSVRLVNIESGEHVVIARQSDPRPAGDGSLQNGSLQNGSLQDGGLREIAEKLSGRERQVLEMLGSGLSMEQIATRLGVSIKTIETYRCRIKQKLGIENRTRLLTLAVEWVLSRRGMGDGFGAACPASA
jgi:DNA-binding NarL/FixJ family response regulator